MNAFASALLTLCLGLAASDCPSHWENLGKNCYFFSHDTEAWNNAGTTCRFYSSHLVEIQSDEENKFLTKFISAFSFPSYWIGAADLLNEGEWVWYNTRRIIDNSTYDNFQAGGLDNAAGNENCAQILQSGEWVDGQCDQSRHYICERSVDHNGEVFVG